MSEIFLEVPRDPLTEVVVLGAIGVFPKGVQLGDLPILIPAEPPLALNRKVFEISVPDVNWAGGRNAAQLQTPELRPL